MSNIQFDIVQLPSRGIFYPNKNKKLKVAYLTANDENLLSSVTMMSRSSDLTTELLKSKILDKDIDIENLEDEDIQAVLIFLRNTAFGSEYQITEIDPITNKEFTVTLDLSSINFKDFNLVENENGLYEYEFKQSKSKIEFMFLSKKQKNELKKIEDTWNFPTPPPIATKTLEMTIKSVDGNSDMMFIHNFVKNLPIKDSYDFKKYVSNNKPQLDLNKEITTPSGEKMLISVALGVDFFRPFFGL